MTIDDATFLRGRRAIVTGGATGIGRAITIALAQAGANVAVGSRKASLSAFADVVDGLAGRIVALPLDVTSSAAVALACTTTGRNIGQDEWQRYFPEEAYRRTCPQWPAGQ